MKHIMVVDDEPLILNIIETYLGKNYKISTFDQVSLALEFAKSEKVDLVISDFYMPEMTGLEFSNSLRKANPLLPVILISGSHVQEQEKATFTGFLKKPFRPKEIINLVSEKLKESA